MITREILETQLEQYQQGRAQAINAFEKAKADVSAFNGAIEAVNNLLRILGGLEKAKSKSQESSEAREQKVAEEATAKTKENTKEVT